jgi:hypothetical protein
MRSEAGSQSVISADRRIDWSQAGVIGGIPARAADTCATLGPGATAERINEAIRACRGGVVYLTAGTYELSTGITFRGRSGITLRGAGPDRTILKFSGSDPCGGIQANVCVRGMSDVWLGNIPAANIRNWVGGYAKGTTEIALDSTAGLTTGTILILDQLDDAADGGGIIVSDSRKFSLEELAPGRPDRAQQQFVQVVAVKGKQVVISPGLHMPNWRESRRPQVWWWGDQGATAVMNGIENLTVDHTKSAGTSGIAFSNAYGGWARNVKSLNANRNHVWLNQAARIEVRDSYFYGTRNAATQSYGVESFMTSDDLVVNNIFEHVTTPLMTGPSAGCVYAYNFMTDMAYSIPSWMMAGINGSHDAGTGMNLFEGNVANAFLMDLYHGPGAFATLFRNRLSGIEPGKTHVNPSASNWGDNRLVRKVSRVFARLTGSNPVGGQGNTSVVNIWGFNRFVNIVANVLGTAGYHRVYEDSRAPSGVAGVPDRAIYLLGYTGVEEGTPLGYDPLVVSTMLRWGNHDAATDQVRWNTAEIPAGHPKPPTDLPASLFLSARPNWWSGSRWPAIGPDVTGGSEASGHAHKIPAQACHETSAKNPDGTLVFDPSRCYGRTSSSNQTHAAAAAR